jgi:hypothetical protein
MYSTGIGGGYNNTDVTIIIEGNALVTATGGSYGAGIGNGLYGDKAPDISIASTATVKAYSMAYSDRPAIHASDNSNLGDGFYVNAYFAAPISDDSATELRIRANGGATVTDTLELPADYACFAYTTQSDESQDDLIDAYEGTRLLGRVIREADRQAEIYSVDDEEVLAVILETVFTVSGQIRFDGGLEGVTGDAQVYILNGADQIIRTVNIASLYVEGDEDTDPYFLADFAIGDIVPGTYSFVAHKKNHTTVKVTGIAVTDQDITIVLLLALYAGDLDATGGGATIWGDGQINGLDSSLLSMSFEQVMTPHPIDLNDNGQIEALDRSLFSKNFLKMSRIIAWS